MKFRKIYWVTEQVGGDGSSQIAGVYTSIHDLIDRGTLWMDGCEKRSGFRVTLVQLDSDKLPLGSWRAPEFNGLESDLQEYVASGELNSQDIEGLATELRAFFSR